MSAHTILITGGAGYVGSHVTVELIAAGYTAVIVDNREGAVKGIYFTIKFTLNIQTLAISFIAPDMRGDPHISRSASPRHF